MSGRNTSRVAYSVVLQTGLKAGTRIAAIAETLQYGKALELLDLSDLGLLSDHRVTHLVNILRGAKPELLSKLTQINMKATKISHELIVAAKQLETIVGPMKFAPPVTHVYNPLTYAWPAHEAYLRRFGSSRKRIQCWRSIEDPTNLKGH